MTRTAQLKEEFSAHRPGIKCCFDLAKSRGYRKAAGRHVVTARAWAIASLFEDAVPHIYKNDLIVGSSQMKLADPTPQELEQAQAIVRSFGERGFQTNSDHFCPDYARILSDGIPGVLKRIDDSLARWAEDEERVRFLNAQKTAFTGFAAMIAHHESAARALIGQDGYDEASLRFIADNCRAILNGPPATFAEALQLVWFCHTAFLLEERYAMALGRMDQYLYPFYEKDIREGSLTEEQAQLLLENVFIKIYERNALFGGDDVVNIAIGGTAPDGSCQVNALSYHVLHAVDACHVPGPNLSARITPDTPDAFLDDCLRVIGTGLGYPALMNDTVNMAALSRYGYAHEDVCNYSMVGCIENFITGMQPAWSDGRFDTPKYLEYLFNGGRSIFESSCGLDTGAVEDITSMDEFMRRYSRQLEAGVASYVTSFYMRNTALNPKNYVSPFLSCFCQDCIGRGKDINDGGAVYPSAHGIGLMGIGTVCDSLAAIEKVVFVDHAAALADIREAMKADFKGWEELQKLLLDAPKYGNNDDFVDKYAVWYVDFFAKEFAKYRTPDGGGFYTAIAANVQNISAGAHISATPDGRHAGTPISDAGSPTYGRDKKGPTSTVLSVSKPDYTTVACGSVVNQKYSPAMFNDENRPKLLALIRVYFRRGGQEMQINATSRQTLEDAMEHPEQYSDLVVRVSGFSAYFTTLNRSVQEDILARTQQG